MKAAERAENLWVEGFFPTENADSSSPLRKVLISNKPYLEGVIENHFHNIMVYL